MGVYSGEGKIVVLGSTDMFNDDNFEKEENQKVFDFILKFFFSNEIEFEKKPPQLDADYRYAPDIAELAEKLKSCLQESEELPKDVTTLFDSTLFKFDIDAIPEAIKLYEQLGVKHEPLSLIVP